MKLFLKYCRRVFIRWEGVFGLITFAAIAASTFIGKDVLFPTWIWVLILILSLYLGTFSAYKEIVEKLPKTADLTIVGKSVVFSARSWSGGIPSSPLRFRITLDVINRGQEPAFLNELNVTKFDLNTDLLGDQPLSKRLYKPNHPHADTEIHLPYPIPGGHREPNLKLEMNVQLCERTPLLFARRLNELDDYEIELQYSYEDMLRASHSGSIRVQESFTEFREHVIASWKKNEQFELVCEARGY